MSLTRLSRIACQLDFHINTPLVYYIFVLLYWVEHVIHEVDNLKSDFTNGVCPMSNRKIMERKRHPTKLKDTNSDQYEVPMATRSGQRRTKETMEFCANVHEVSMTSNLLWMACG